MKSRTPFFTHKQGQYLAFIHYYRKLNGRSPAESDFQRFFKVTPPTVHGMIVSLTDKQLIDRVSGTPRSITLRIDPTELPSLD